MTVFSFCLQRRIRWIMAAEAEVELGSEYPAHYKVMMDKLNEQRQLDQFTDITLIVDGKEAYIVGHLYDVLVKHPSNTSYFHVYCLLQDTSSEPIKQCWPRAASSSTSSSRILPRSHWLRLKVFCVLILISIFGLLKNLTTFKLKHKNKLFQSVFFF